MRPIATTCQRFATECLDAADRVASVKDRDRLRQTAEVWLNLASEEFAQASKRAAIRSAYLADLQRE
jgi:hypothetical protein